MTVCGWVNVLLVEGASEEPLGIEEEGGGRVRERLSLTETDEGCGGLNLSETQTSKDHFHSREDGVFDLGALTFPPYQMVGLGPKSHALSFCIMTMAEAYWTKFGSISLNMAVHHYPTGKSS